MIDISQTKIRDYLDKFKPEVQEYVAHVICNGEAFINAFEDSKVKIVLEVMSETCNKEIEEMLNLIGEGKYNEEEELRRIRLNCIGIKKILDIVAVWGSKINSFNRHLEKL